MQQLHGPEEDKHALMASNEKVKYLERKLLEVQEKAERDQRSNSVEKGNQTDRVEIVEN